MIGKIKSFYQKYKYAIWWTAGYVLMTYLILKLMFNFSIFSAAQWHKLMRAHLYGFAGFVFGILILAAVPLYVATMTLIIRGGAPLFKIPLPRVPAAIRNLGHRSAPAPAPESAPAPATSPAPAPADDFMTQLPPNMPSEMRASYVRARKYGSEFAIAQRNVMAMAPDGATGNADAPRPGELPIPTDFDFDIPEDTSSDVPQFSDVPVFSDISFDEPTDTDAATTPVPDMGDDAPDEYNGAVLEYLESVGRAARVVDGVVVSDGVAIASHIDGDFWIADEDSWFAPGRARPSPIAALNRVAAVHDVRAILYLGATNIMDIDARRAAWESAGITVITDLAQI